MLLGGRVIEYRMPFFFGGGSLKALIPIFLVLRNTLIPFLAVKSQINVIFVADTQNEYALHYNGLARSKKSADFI